MATSLGTQLRKQATETTGASLEANLLALKFC